VIGDARECALHDKQRTLSCRFEEAVMIKTRIVVGVDGSPGSTAALRWAAAEARRRQTDLRVLTAYHRQISGRTFTTGLPAPPITEDKRADIVHAAVTHARSVAPDIEVRGVALPGYAAPVLLHAAEEAALLVVGDRRGGGLPGRPSGSVGTQVANHARSSVVVVRGRADADTGPVVAACDDGPAATTIIGRAFEEAARRGAPLLVVATGAGARPPGGPTAEDVLGTDIDSQLEVWREKYPEVEVRREVVTDRTDKVLVERSQRAQLVVMGPCGHGPEPTLLDAVCVRVLQHADCPVLVARP
jgi:nucleotide-binding universal stress UspA family protein